MAKKKNSVAPVPMEVTPAIRRKWAAESMAQTIVDTQPKRKKAVDQITQAVLRAGQKAAKKALAD